MFKDIFGGNSAQCNIEAWIQKCEPAFRRCNPQISTGDEVWVGMSRDGRWCDMKNGSCCFY